MARTKRVHDLITGLTVDIPLTPEEEAEADAAQAADQAAQQEPAALRLVADTADLAVCKADNQVTNFLNMSPAELDTWVDNNVGGAATLAALRTATATALKVLGRLALMAARGRKLRNGA